MYDRLKMWMCLLAVAMLAMTSPAAALDYFDDFESYTAGSPLPQINGWEGWYGDAGSVGTVSNLFASSGANSLAILGTNDQVNTFTGAAQTAGVWELSTMVYIPGTSVNGSSWLGIDNDYNWGGPTTTALNTYFDLGNNVIAGTEVPLLRDQWAELNVFVDLDRGSYTASYGGTPLSSGRWGGDLEAINLWPNGADVIYYDDVSLKDLTLRWDENHVALSWGSAHWNPGGGPPDATTPALLASTNTDVVQVDAPGATAYFLTVEGGGIDIQAGRTLTVGGAQFAAGTTLAMGDGATLSAGSGNIPKISPTGSITIDVADGLRGAGYDNASAGVSPTLTKTGPGTYTLDNTGGTAVSAAGTTLVIDEGTLSTAGANPLGGATEVVLDGGKLVIDAGTGSGGDITGFTNAGEWVFNPAGNLDPNPPHMDTINNTLTVTTEIASQATATWYQGLSTTSKQDVTSFEIEFDYQNLSGVTGPSGNTPADGIAIVLQNASADATALGTTVGAGGGGLGYLNIPDSVAIMLSLYNNGDDDPATFPNPGIQLGTGGGFDIAAYRDVGPVDIITGDIHIKLQYDGTTLYADLEDNDTGNAYSTSWEVDIPGLVGGNEAWIGVTGGTGGAVALQEVRNLQNDSIGGAVNLPTTNILVSDDSTLEIRTVSAANFGQLTMAAGTITTQGPGAGINFTGTLVNSSAAWVGFDPQTPTNYGGINANNVAGVVIAKDGSSTWVFDNGTTPTNLHATASFEVADGTLDLQGTNSLAGRPITVTAGTLTTQGGGALASSHVTLAGGTFEVTTTGVSAGGIAGFGDGSGFTLSGNDASILNGVPNVNVVDELQLTNGIAAEQHSNVFFNTKQDVTKFSVEFDYRIAADSGTPADEWSFIIQNSPAGAAALSPLRGYGGITDSIALLTNVWGFSEQWVATAGVRPVNGTGRPTTPIDFRLQRPVHARLDYDGATLFVAMEDMATGATFNTSYPVDIAGELGDTEGYFGFGGGTGGAWADWRFTNFTNAVDNLVDPIVAPDVDMTVTEDSVLNPFTYSTAQFGNLTLANGILTTSRWTSDAISFATTTIDASATAVGIHATGFVPSFNATDGQIDVAATGPVTFSKADPNTWVLGAPLFDTATNYTNVTWVVDAGTLQPTAAGVLQNLPVTVNPAGVLTAQGGAALAGSHITLAGGALEVTTTGGTSAGGITGFGDGSGFSLGGNAASLNNGVPNVNVVDELQLTNGVAGEQHSNVFFNTKQDVTKFSVEFDYRIAADSGTPADEWSFIIQNSPAGAAALSNVRGYGGITDSVAVLTNIWGASEQWVATDGVRPGNNTGRPTAPIDFRLQNTVHTRLDYDGTTLSVAMEDLVTGGTFNTSYEIDIAGELGDTEGYFGFGAGTGGAWADWRFTNFTNTLTNLDPIVAPDVDITVTQNSLLNAITNSSAQFGDLTLANGILTTRAAHTGGISFATTTIDASATAVGIHATGPVASFNATDGQIDVAATAPVTFSKAGPNTWMLGAPLFDTATNYTNVAWAVDEGTLQPTAAGVLQNLPVTVNAGATLQVVEADPLIGSPLTLNGGTLFAESTQGASTIPSGMSAHWAFEGNANDSAGANDGTLWGNYGFVPGVNGGQALLLDGTIANNAYVDLPDGFQDFSTGFTVAFWAKPTEVRNWSRFIDFGNGPAVDNILFNRQDTSNTLWFENHDGTGIGAQAVAVGNTIVVNEWQHLVGSIDAENNGAIYKDGVQIWVGKMLLPANVLRTNNYIGRSNWYPGDVDYAGLMDEMYIYPRGLGADEVAAMVGYQFLDMTSINTTVTADSTISSVGDGAAYGTVTMAGGILTVSGAPTTLAALDFPASGTMGLNTQAPTALVGPLTGNGATVTFVKTGPRDFTLDSAAVSGVDDFTFDVQEGSLIGLHGSNPFGTATLQLSGGNLLLAAKPAAGPAVLYDNEMTVTTSSTLTAGAADTGTSNVAVTLGSAGKGLALLGAATNLTVKTTDGYGLEVDSTLSGDGGLTVDDPATMLTLAGPGSSAARMTVAAGALSTAGNDVTLSNRLTRGEIVYDVSPGDTFAVEGSDVLAEANITLNGGTLTISAGGGGGLIDGFGSLDPADWAINHGGLGPANVPGSPAVDELQITSTDNDELNSVFFRTPQDVSFFNFSFDYQILNENPVDNPADGIAFVLQNDPRGVTAVGDGGFGRGYQNIQDSVAVLFDVWGNSDARGINLGENGVIGPTIEVDTGVPPLELHTRHLIHTEIVYNGTDIAVTLTDLDSADPLNPATFGTNFPVDIASAVGAGTALIGFTGGTGGANADQRITNFIFEGIAAPVDDPTTNLIVAANSTLNIPAGEVLVGDLTLAPGVTFILEGAETLDINDFNPGNDSTYEGSLFVRGTIGNDALVGTSTIFGLLEMDEGSEDGTRLSEAGLHVDIAGDQHDIVQINGDFDVASGAFLAGSLSVAGLSPRTNAGSSVWGDAVLTVMELIDTASEIGILGEFAELEGTSIPLSYGVAGTIPSHGDYLGAGMWFGNASDDPVGENGVYYTAMTVDIGVFQAAPGDTDGNRKVEGQDILNILQAGLFGDGVTPEANWGNGDFNSDSKISGEDILALLGTGLFGDGTYPDNPLAAAAGDGVKLVVTANGLVIDTGGATVTGFVLSSESGILTGDDADNLGLFQEDTDEAISGTFAMSLKGEHDLGDVLGETDVDLGGDLSLAYTIAGIPGVFTAGVVVPEPSSFALLGAALGLLVFAWRRRRAS